LCDLAPLPKRSSHGMRGRHPSWSLGQHVGNGAPSCRVAQLTTFLSPSLSTRPAAVGPGIYLPLRDFKPPLLRLSSPDLSDATVLAGKIFVPIPEPGAIRTVIRMLRHVGTDGIGRDNGHPIVPIFFGAETTIPDGRGARSYLAFFCSLDGVIGHASQLLKNLRHFAVKPLIGGG